MSLFQTFSSTYADRAALRRHRKKFKLVLERVESYHLNQHPGGLLKSHQKLKEQIRRNPDKTGAFLPDAFGIFSEMSLRVFGFRPNLTQLFGGIVLWEGEALNMRTGEGKTLTAALPAYLQALKGQGMHIITTNDYLASRDKTLMSMIFDQFGITCGLVTEEIPRPLRKAEYAKDITYISNQEIGFDYLYDNLVTKLEDKVLNGFPYAIIDEIDSILIDEARTSLIISSPRDTPLKGSFPGILGAAKSLLPDNDYDIDYRTRTVALTEEGIRKLVAILGQDLFEDKRVEIVHQVLLALFAMIFLEKDRDYIIENNKIVLVNEFTGHKMPDERLLDGLHQAVEAKEGVPFSYENAIAASITYQSLFKMYGKFTGMSGTALGASEEFSKLYDLEVVDVSPYRQVIRADLPAKFFRTEAEKFNFVIHEIEAVLATHLPILVIGRTIASIKKFSDLLYAAGLKHQVLHAATSEKEFGIIDAAGKADAITVATNMAGRGADIIIDKELKYKSGLVVFGLEPNLARRIDSQLSGRSGRQGGLGMSRIFASLEDEIFQTYGDEPFWRYAEHVDWKKEGVQAKKLDAYLETAQALAESLAAEAREVTLGFEDILAKNRTFIYAFRDSILVSKNLLRDIMKSVREILFKEYAHNRILNKRQHVVRLEILDYLEGEKALYKNRDESFDYIEAILDCVLYHAPKYMPPLVAKLFSKVSSHEEKARLSFLKFIDELWEEYFDGVYFLENAIFIEGLANNDPLDRFIKESDLIFHNERKLMALKIVKFLFELLTKT